MILAGWPFVRASSALGSRHHSSGKELGQSPYVQKWKRTCPAWTSYATTLLSAFGWRRRPALRDKNPFSSKWPKDGLRSLSTPRRRKQDRHCEDRRSRRINLMDAPRRSVQAEKSSRRREASCRAAAHPRRATAKQNCESASNFDPWRSRCNPLQLRGFSRKRGGPSWTPIEHARNKQFRFCFNDLMHNRGGVQVGRRFTHGGRKTGCRHGNTA